MTSFSWLHLTDLHWCTDEDQAWLWPRMEQEFFDDLAGLLPRCGALDLVLFTGDIVNRGSFEEFQGVKGVNALLDRLWKHLDKLGSKPFLLAVPGNHDLKRPDPDRHCPELVLLGEWSSRSDVQKEFWNNPDSQYRQAVAKSFENYRVWWDGQSSRRPPSSCAGMLPGDFSATIEKGTSKLGIVGLNTTFLQLARGNYERRLALSARQFHQACGGNGTQWAREHGACLLLTHHPPTWLTRDSERELMAEVDPRQFAVHLFGHMHEPEFHQSSKGGAVPRRLQQGRSLFGLEFFEGTAGNERRSHGYSVGRIELAKGACSLTIWPREARMVQNHQWKLMTDRSYGVDLIDESYTEIFLVFAGERLVQPTEGWEGPETSFRKAPF